jgi:uncharacterized protein YegP (UPF0339 family)
MATFYIYIDASRDFRWRLKSVNGRIIADSGEGYETRQGVDSAIVWMKTYTKGADVVDSTE